MKTLSEKRITNCLLTKKIIDLHKQGYTYDFHVINQDEIVCDQDNSTHYLRCVMIRIIDQCYDVMSHTYKYVHTIDTPCGYKGLLITNKIYTAMSIASRQELLSLQFA